MEPGSAAYRARFAVALIFLGVGVLTLWQAQELPFGTVSLIRAGFFPKVFGVLVVFLSFLVCGQLLRARFVRTVEAPSSSDSSSGEGPDESGDQAVDQTGSSHWAHVWLMSGVFFLYPALATLAGHVVAATATLAASGYLMGVRTLWKLGVMAISIALATTIIFGEWLAVPLPTPFWHGR